MIDDNDFVYAFTPRKIDGPRFVAEDREELDQLVGSQIGAEQCDGCGNNVYEIVRTERGEIASGNYSYHAKCVLDESPDEFTHDAPCGAMYRIDLSRAGETVF